jgi:iron complex transport system substrate-binding protein
MKAFCLVISIFIFIASCTGRKSPPAESVTASMADDFTRYAGGFSIVDGQSFTLVEVSDPWQQSRNVIFTYVLAPNPGAVPDSLKGIPFIRTPVERVITLSTTHVAMIEQLGSGGSIAGISGAGYMFSPAIRSGMESGRIKDVGYGQGLDYEAIVRMQPDVVFLYGVEGNVMTILEKLRDLNVPAVFCGEYLETHPLGKAEWIKYFSLFYDKKEQAENFFREIDSAYNALSAIVPDNIDKPNVLNGLPWKDTWYMAGGKSFAAKLIEDAGGAYLWSDSPSSQAIPLDLESVYLRAVQADIWINPGAAASLADIRLLDDRLGDLESLRRGNVFNNDARISEGGGNDYWESGTVRPDLVLADLISVFHPELLPDHSYVYYRKLK